MEAPTYQAPQIAYAWIGGLVGLILLVIVVVLIVDACSKDKTRGNGGNKENVRNLDQAVKTKVKEQVERVRANLRVNNDPMPPLAPLVWNNDEGAFMIELVVGEGPIQFVLDTGSSQVSAKVDGCMWTQCENDTCVEQACPCENGNCALHYYTPSKSGTRIAAGSGYQTTMTYGSQQDTVSHMLDTVTIPKLVVTCQQLMQPSLGLNGQWKQLMRLKQGPPVSTDMVVHQVHRIKGTSTSNMFGLARPGEHMPTVLDKLFQAGVGNQKVWSLLLHEQTGWWALGPIPCFHAKQTMPLIYPPLFQPFVTKFYVVKLLDLEAGPTLGHLKSITASAMPKYVVIDTGTTYTYGNTKLGAALDKLGYDERSWYLKFTLGSRSNPTTLVYTPEALKDPDFPTSSVLQCTEGRTLDSFDAMFDNHNVLLWGVYMMRDKYWEFNLSASTVAVESLEA